MVCPPHTVCGNTRLLNNYSFLEGPKAALVASKDFDNGHYKSVPQHGVRAFGRAYSAWAYGQTVSLHFLRQAAPTYFSTVVPQPRIPSRRKVREIFMLATFY